MKQHNILAEICHCLIQAEIQRQKKMTSDNPANLAERRLSEVKPRQPKRVNALKG